MFLLLLFFLSSPKGICFSLLLPPLPLHLHLLFRLSFPKGTCFFNLMPREYHFWVYILASRSRNLYIGMTNSLTTRLATHRKQLMERTQLATT